MGRTFLIRKFLLYANNVTIHVSKLNPTVPYYRVNRCRSNENIVPPRSLELAHYHDQPTTSNGGCYHGSRRWRQLPDCVVPQESPQHVTIRRKQLRIGVGLVRALARLNNHKPACTPVPQKETHNEMRQRRSRKDTSNKQQNE